VSGGAANGINAVGGDTFNYTAWPLNTFPINNYGITITPFPGSAATYISGFGDLALFTAEADRLHITGSGNVGIGTTTPNYKLDVAGTVNASSLMINGVAVGTSSSPWLLNGANTYYNAGNVRL
jgi:hypothetical protein